MKLTGNSKVKNNFGYKIIYSLLQVFVLIILSVSLSYPAAHYKPGVNNIKNDSTIVEKYGQLHVEGTKIVDKNGNPVSLRGMSFFWSQWMGRFYNYNCVKWLRDDFKCTVVRAAMGVESGGYLQNPVAEMNKIKTVIDACINLGIYVIVDWHDDNAQNFQQQSVDFFKQIAALYGNQPNLIYEIYNEPQQISWTNVIKPYAISIIDGIRSIDPDNIIVVGTPTWSQDVDTASRNPLQYSNIAYTLHFYAATHKQALRNKATTAINNGIALFVTEWGTCEATGTGFLDSVEVENWMTFMETNKLSWCNWSVADKVETSAALKPNVDSNGSWSDSSLTPSGFLVRGKIRHYNDTTATDIEGNREVPLNFDLKQNYPNPFNPGTKIKYSLAPNRAARGGVPEEQELVVLKVFNMLGKEVALLVNEEKGPGTYTVDFNAANLPSGVYFYELRKGSSVETRKMILMK
jgi:endoglucanase